MSDLGALARFGVSLTMALLFIQAQSPPHPHSQQALFPWDGQSPHTHQGPYGVISTPSRASLRPLPTHSLNLV